ncbi:hypothetical protein [Kytococcus sp. Marseille-QA3725]
MESASQGAAPEGPGEQGDDEKVSAYERAERWVGTVQGRRVEGRFLKDWPEKKAWLLVDDVCVGRAEDDDTIRVHATSGTLDNVGWSAAERERVGFGEGATLEVRHARGTAMDMDLVPGIVHLSSEGLGRGRMVSLTPPAGSPAERFHALRDRRPRLAAARFLVMKLGWLLWAAVMLVLGPLLDRIMAWLERHMPHIPWPRIPWPDITWPDVHLPRIPWPSLPSIPWPNIPWPDLSWLWHWLSPLRPVLLWILDNDKLIFGVIVGLALARGELKRQRARREAAEAERREELQRLASAMQQVVDRGQAHPGRTASRGSARQGTDRSAEG